MEILLLWVDELDDAVHALRHLAPRILSTILPVALVGLAGFILVH
jgi:hypothetical protein